MKHFSLKIAVSLALMFTVLSAPLSVQAASDNPHTIVTVPVQDFSEIKIIGVSSDYSRGMFGYPGITITKAQDSWGSVSYNEICSGFVSAEVENGVLTVTVDCKFLSPRSGWNPVNGIIDAITISVPANVELKSIVNEGAYYTNMSLTDLKQSSLSVTASNSVNMQNCKIGRLSWKPVEGKPLAAMCDYNICLTCSRIGKLLVPAESASAFKVNVTFGSRIKAVDWVK